MVRAEAVAHSDQHMAGEDAARAGLYRLLARLLSRAASSKDLSFVRELAGGSGEIGEAVDALADIASRVDANHVAQEYHDLFIGIGRGELVPYGSYYLTGFLNEKPLAKLRNRMAELGIERNPDVAEPEDHAASVLDMMAGLIDGTFAEAGDIDTQHRFFADHVEPWMGHFFRDLEQAKSSAFYAPVGQLGRKFIEVEGTAFSMD